MLEMKPKLQAMVANIQASLKNEIKCAPLPDLPGLSLELDNLFPLTNSRVIPFVKSCCIYMY